MLHCHVLNLTPETRTRTKESVNVLQFSSGCLRLPRGGSSCWGHTKPNTRPHLSPGAPPVCPQCQDKDPSQPGKETDPYPPRRPISRGTLPLMEGEKVAADPPHLSQLLLCAFPWGGGALIFLLGVSLQKHKHPPPRAPSPTVPTPPLCCTINPKEQEKKETGE